MPPAATPRRMDDLLQVNTLPSLDSNNNAAGGSGRAGSEAEDSKHSSQDSAVTIKYSLRPRSLHKRRLVLDDDADDDFGRSCSGDGSTDAASPASEDSGGGGGGGGGGGRGRGGRRAKRKPPPLSRYRRRTANARERERMREINAAFEALRRAVPPHAAAHRAEDAASGFYTGSDDGSEHQARSGEKVTKIATLRLAMSYIAELTRSLEAVSASEPPPAPLPPVSTLCRPQTLLLPPPAAPAAPASAPAAPASAPAAAACASAAAFMSCLTPPLSLTPCSSSALPELGDALTPPDLCGGLTVDLALTPPPGLDEHCLTPH